MTAETPIIVRASSLSGYPDCPRRAACKSWPHLIEAQGYTLNRLPAGIGAAVGTATHAGASYTLVEKMERGGLGNATEAEQRALQALDDEIREGVAWDATTVDLNTAQLQSIRQVKAYRAFVAPTVEPVQVEVRLEAEIAPGWVLSGQPDVREQGRIRDTKTGTRPAYHGAQVGAYALLVKTVEAEVQDIAIDFIQRVSVKKPQPDPERESYEPRAAERLAWNVIQRMRGDVEAFVQSGDIAAFLPNSMSVLCGPKWCPAHGTDACRAHRAL